MNALEGAWLRRLADVASEGQVQRGAAAGTSGSSKGQFLLVQQWNKHGPVCTASHGGGYEPRSLHGLPPPPLPLPCLSSPRPGMSLRPPAGTGRSLLDPSQSLHKSALSFAAGPAAVVVVPIANAVSSGDGAGSGVCVAKSGQDRVAVAPSPVSKCAPTHGLDEGNAPTPVIALDGGLGSDGDKADDGGGDEEGGGGRDLFDACTQVFPTTMQDAFLFVSSQLSFSQTQEWVDDV